AGTGPLRSDRPARTVGSRRLRRCVDAGPCTPADVVARRAADAGRGGVGEAAEVQRAATDQSGLSNTRHPAGCRRHRTAALLATVRLHPHAVHARVDVTLETAGWGV